jgi:hypothetical protein
VASRALRQFQQRLPILMIYADPSQFDRLPPCPSILSLPADAPPHHPVQTTVRGKRFSAMARDNFRKL